MNENISQRKLTEVLTHIVEILKETSKELNKTAPLIVEQLKGLKEQEIIVTLDTSKFEEILDKFNEKFKRHMILPMWMSLYLGIVTAVVIAQAFVIYSLLIKA